MATPTPDQAGDIPALEEEPERPARSGLSWPAALLAVSALGGLVHLSLTEINPDWGAYQAIYDSQGAWLADAGRDPLFTALVALSHSLWGADGYENWRAWLAAWFVTFSILLASGRVIPALPFLSRQADTWPTEASGWPPGQEFSPAHGLRMVKLSLWAVAVTITYLGFTRFTIQVREGLAVTLALIGLGLLLRYHWAVQREEEAPEVWDPDDPSSAGSWSGWTLLGLAGMMHLATAVLLLVALGARWVAAAYKPVTVIDMAAAPQDGTPDGREAADVRLAVLWVVALGLAALAVFEVDTGGALETIALDTAGERLANQREVSIEVVGLWALYGGVCAVLRWQAAAQAAETAAWFTAALLRTLAGPAVFAVYALVLACLALDASTVVMTNFIRLLHLLLAVLLTLLALSGARAWLIATLGLLLIADQVRSIVQSISQTFGIDLI